MPGKKGMHWDKPKANKKKLNTLVSSKTYSKLHVLSQLGVKLKKKAWATPSAMAGTIIEENIDNYFEKIGANFKEADEDKD
jgi:hypothetical protein